MIIDKRKLYYVFLPYLELALIIPIVNILAFIPFYFNGSAKQRRFEK
jgi:hypothetical protein